MHAAIIHTGHDMPAEPAWPTFCIVHVCRFCFIYCGLRLYAQSHSDNDHVHATALCFTHALAQARSSISCILLVSVLIVFVSWHNAGGIGTYVRTYVVCIIHNVHAQVMEAENSITLTIAVKRYL